jgi:hypothetical protein
MKPTTRVNCGCLTTASSGESEGIFDPSPIRLKRFDEADLERTRSHWKYSIDGVIVTAETSVNHAGTGE